MSSVGSRDLLAELSSPIVSHLARFLELEETDAVLQVRRMTGAVDSVPEGISRMRQVLLDEVRGTNLPEGLRESCRAVIEAVSFMRKDAPLTTFSKELAAALKAKFIQFLLPLPNDQIPQNIPLNLLKRVWFASMQIARGFQSADQWEKRRILTDLVQTEQNLSAIALIASLPEEMLRNIMYGDVTSSAITDEASIEKVERFVQLIPEKEGRYKGYSALVGRLLRLNPLAIERPKQIALQLPIGHTISLFVYANLAEAQCALPLLDMGEVRRLASLTCDNRPDRDLDRRMVSIYLNTSLVKVLIDRTPPAIEEAESIALRTGEGSDRVIRALLSLEPPAIERARQLADRMGFGRALAYFEIVQALLSLRPPSIEEAEEVAGLIPSTSGDIRLQANEAIENARARSQ